MKHERSLTLVRWTGASLLAFLAACAGRYDVGDAGPDGGAAVTSGGSDNGTGGSDGTTGGSAGSQATGGTSTGGASGGGTGGTGTAAGGTGTGGSTGGSGTGTGGAGTSSGGAQAAGGSSAGSSAGGSAPAGGTGGGPISGNYPDLPTCGAQTNALDTSGPLASPSVLNERISVMLNDMPWQGGLDLPNPPVEATVDWVVETVTRELDVAAMNDTPPGGLERFFNSWLPGGGPGPLIDITSTIKPTVELAASQFNRDGATFVDLIAPESWGGLLRDPLLNRLRPNISGRGFWIQKALFCTEVGDEPLNTGGLITGTATMTRREVLEADVASAACRGCHTFTDPPGFSLEGFDPTTGMPRTEDENGLPLDTSGTLVSQANQYSFTSIDDLAPQLATSCEVAQCFVSSFTSNATDAVGLPRLSATELDYVLYEYVTQGFSLRGLVLALVRTPTFLQ